MLHKLSTHFIVIFQHRERDFRDYGNRSKSLIHYIYSEYENKLKHASAVRKCYHIDKKVTKCVESSVQYL